MANQWLRLWHDMPTDPKWRTIAKVSGQRIGDVMAVYCHLLVCASNANERGRTQSFNCEDVASALDIETSDVAAIVDAMQSRVIDGDRLKGWDVRQVAREDGGAERAKAWREDKKASERTQTNANERKRTPDTDTDKDTDIHKEQDQKKEPARKRANAKALPCPDGVTPSVWDDWLALRKAKRAPVTDTVLAHAVSESVKASLTLDAFLKIWCGRGSQGLEAAWLKPNERGPPASKHSAADSFHGKIYTGTAIDDYPPELRDAIRAELANA